MTVASILCTLVVRERRDGIPLLADALLQRVAAGRTLGISAAVMALLMAYDYPGNVRELRNLLERASLLCDGDELRPEHLATEVRAGRGAVLPQPELDSPAAWDEMQLKLFRETVSARRGTRRELARKLGMNLRTLYRRLAEAKIKA